MEAVLETYVAADFALWPFDDSPADRFLALSGDLSSREVGTAMAVLTNCNKGHRERRARDPQDSMEQVRRLVTAERVVAPGGLRVRDTATATVVSPGCCCGLENWRDWHELMNGETPWLGHDPTPRVEHLGETARLWPGGECFDGLPIDLPLTQLPELLGGVQDQLGGFLTSVEEWAAQYAAPLAAVVVAKLDEDLSIAAPFRQTQG
ncbi:hypothetical protein GCM10010278_82090 [Streptomyces melanogenes]|nr:hypothetical protein GCM10010278_82090 [Streptomyces melanogenes]